MYLRPKFPDRHMIICCRKRSGNRHKEMELKTHLAVPPIATCLHLLANRNKTVRFAGAASSKRRIEKRVVDSLETLLRSSNTLAKCCKKVDPKATRHCREEECERGMGRKNQFKRLLKPGFFQKDSCPLGWDFPPQVHDTKTNYNLTR